MQQHFKVGHPPPYSDVVASGPNEGEPRHSDQLGDEAPLPPYRDVEEEAGGEGEDAGYVMHPEDLERGPERRGRWVPLRRWLVSSCDASLARFFVGLAVVGVVLWCWLR